MRGVVEQTPYITIAKGGERYTFVHGSNIIEDIDFVIDRYMIDIDSTECNYGGWREWLICPICEKRKLSLFYQDYEFKCKECAGLLYDIQTVSESYRRTFNALIGTLKIKYKMENNRRPYYNGELTKRSRKQLRDLGRYSGLFKEEFGHL
jgi:hypothetical protein